MSKLNKTITVIGCGWLGLPFAEYMVNNGWMVKGSTTNKIKLSKLADAGIEGYVLNLEQNDAIDSNLLKAGSLLINIPPGRKNSDVVNGYPVKIKRLIDAVIKIGSIQRIVFVSATSVYGSVGVIDELSETVPETASGKAILLAEQVVIESGLPSVILRFGGLAGPQRHPGNFLAGRSQLPSGNQLINFLHLADAIGVTAYMFDHNIRNEIFNVVAPMHPTKQMFYEKMASLIDVQAPEFSGPPAPTVKEISVQKLLEKTGYVFKHPDPLNFRF